MNIYFKSVELSEVEDILTFIKEYYKYDDYFFDNDCKRAAIKKLIHHTEWGRIWFICKDKRRIGYVVLTLGYSLEYLGRNAFVDEIYIREGDRSQAIGQATFQFLEDFCRSLEVNALHLEVERSNTNVQAVYRQLGFHDQKRFLMTRWLFL